MQACTLLRPIITTNASDLQKPHGSRNIILKTNDNSKGHVIIRLYFQKICLIKKNTIIHDSMNGSAKPCVM